MKITALVVLYLAAIVAANLFTVEFGPQASIYSAFLFIGLDFVCRDRLHDLFAERRVLGMGALIVTGSVFSYALNADAGRIALASCAAFALAATADALVYHWRRARPWAQRSNESNIAGAAVDSLVFPALAFPGPLMWVIVFGQFTAKVAGGAIFSLLLKRGRA